MGCTLYLNKIVLKKIKYVDKPAIAKLMLFSYTTCVSLALVFIVYNSYSHAYWVSSTHVASATVEKPKSESGIDQRSLN